MKTLAALLALFFLAAPAVAEAPAAAKGLAQAAGVSKHYDPAHLGHWHQCGRCGAKYHQQGDSGPYSPGSNVCPRCGFANPVPPSPPNPYQPPYTPPQPPPYQPPSPPYYPPSYVNVDEILELARRTYNYTEKDRILLDGSRRVNDGVGILKLWAEAWTDATRREILAAFQRGPMYNPPDYATIVRFYDKCPNYNAADEMLVAVSTILPSARTRFYLGAKFFNAAPFNRFAQALEAAPNLSDPPTLDDMRKIHRDCHNYTNGDRLLLAACPYFRAYTDLVRLAEIAFSPQVRRQIMDYASQYGGGSYPGPYGSGQYPGGGYAPVGYPQAHRAPGAGAAREIAAADDSGVNLDKSEIAAGSLDKVAAFVARYKAGKIKKSPLRAETAKAVREFLKVEALKGDSPDAARLLEEMDR